MSKRFKKFLSTSIIFAVLNQIILPVGFSAKAGVNEKIKRNNQKIEELKGKKAKETKSRKNLEQNISRVNSEIINLTKQIKMLKNQNYKNQEEINKSINNIESLSNQIKNIDLDLENTINTSNQLQNELSNYLKEIYMNGSQSLLEIFLSSKDFVNFINNLEYFKSVSGQIGRLIKDCEEHTKKIEQNKKSKQEEINKINLQKQEMAKQIDKSSNQAIDIEKLRQTQYSSYENLNNLLKQTNKKTKEFDNAMATLQKLTKKFEKEEKDTTKAVELALKNQQQLLNKQNQPNQPNQPNQQNQPKKDQKSGHVFPVQGRSSIFQTFHRGHPAIDIQTYGKPNPVVASKGGVVITASRGGKANKLSGYGNVIIILHNDKSTTLYAHLSSVKVKVGQQVSQGEVIGNVGNTGQVSGRTGMHLHYEQKTAFGQKVPPKF